MDVNNGQQRCSKHPYGSEYKTVLQDGNIKFVKYRLADNAKAPLETQTKGRVYVTVNNDNELSFISYYDRKGETFKDDRPLLSADQGYHDIIKGKEQTAAGQAAP